MTSTNPFNNTVAKARFEELFLRTVSKGETILQKPIETIVAKPRKTYSAAIFRPELQPKEGVEEESKKNDIIGWDTSQSGSNRSGRKASIKFGEAFEIYCSYAKGRLKSYDEIVRIHRRYLKHLTFRSLSTISRNELQFLHGDLGLKAGQTAANRTIELISVIFNHAINLDLYEKHNPTNRLKKFRLKSRERFLKSHELGKFFAAVDQCESQNVRDFVYMALWTAARCGNIISMKWEDVDLADRTWRIPDSKNGDPYTVPLPVEAMRILNNRLPLSKNSLYVFPGVHGGHMGPPNKAWAIILRRACIRDLRIHDLRRSHGSWQAFTGASLPIIGKTLNHRDPQSTAIYARLDLEPVRAAMETAIQAMKAAASPSAFKEFAQQKSNVVLFTARQNRS